MNSGVYEAIRNETNIVSITENLGISIRKIGNSYRANSIDTAGGGENALSIYPETGRWHDFKLNIGGDVTDLVAHLKYNGDKRKAIRELAPMEYQAILNELFKQEDLEQSYISRCHAFLTENQMYPAPDAMIYLRDRKITDETIRNQKIGVDLNTNRIVIPFFDESGNTVRYHTARALGNEQPKYLNAKSNSFLHPVPLGLQTLKRNKLELWITEGIFDYLSLYQENYAVLATAGGAGQEKVLPYASEFERVILAFDSDAAGVDFTKKLAEKLFKRHIDFYVIELPNGIKDISEYYTEGGNLSELSDNAISGLTYLANSFIPQGKLNRNQERKLQSELKDFLIEAARGGADEADIALLVNSLVTGGLPRNFIEAVIKKAEHGETEKEIADKINELHELIYHERTGFYEYSEKRGTWKNRTNTDVGAYVKDYLSFKASTRKINAVVNHIAFKVNSEAPIEQFNKLPLFVFKNGTFESNSGRVRAHSPEDYSTILLDYDFDENAKCERWLQFIDEVTNGDAGRAAVLQEFAGYIFYPDSRFHKILVLIGNGRNGKNVYTDTLRNIFGTENCTSVKASRLGENFQAIHLKDSLLNISSENQGSLRGSEDMLKAISSGDSISDSFKGKDNITFTPRAKLILNLNKYPATQDDSDGFLERLLFVSFEVKFCDEPAGENQRKADRNLLEKLKAERSGIFNWCYEGAKRLSRNGMFMAIQDQKTNIEQFKRLINDVYDFVDEVFDTVYGKRISRKDLYEKYQNYCVENGIQRMKSSKIFIPDFRKALQERGYEMKEVRTATERYFEF